MSTLLDNFTDFCDTKVEIFPYIANTRRIEPGVALKRLRLDDLYLNLVGTFSVNHSLYSPSVSPMVSNMRFSSTQPFLLFTSLN